MEELRRMIQNGGGGGGEMSQQLAMELFENGGVLVLKDFPEGCEFGVDCRSWSVGPKFLGIKMIPPGIHFFYVSVPGAPRIAFFHNFQPKEIVLRRWNRAEEDLFQCTSNEIELGRLRENLKNIDQNLGPYPYQDFQLWASLSSFVTPKTLARLSPTNSLGRISSQVELATQEAELEQKLGDPQGLSVVDRENRCGRIRFMDESGLPVMNEKSEDSKIRFAQIPQITLGDTNVKKAGIDSSERLAKLLKTLDNEHRELLAEFQYAFIVFLIGQVYEGFDQWKRIIHLVCSCTSALKSQPQFFNDFLMALHYQMKMVPDDFFQDVLASNNFLITTLSMMFANIEDVIPPENGLRMKATKFKGLLERRFQREFIVEEEE